MLDAVPVSRRTLNEMLTDLSICPLAITAHTCAAALSGTVTSLCANAT